MGIYSMDFVVKCANYHYERGLEYQIMNNWPVIFYDNLKDMP